MLEKPKEKKYGDWSTNVAMVLASSLKLPPRKVAEIIVKHIEDKHHYLDKVEVAGSGFINFFLSNEWLYEVLRSVKRQGMNFGNSSLGGGTKVLIEFVSANPVGPMHIGHGRWAAVGDSLANIFEAAGFKVVREFYINDYGNQMNIFGKSVAARYLELLEKKVVFPEDGYKGEYIREIAQEIWDKYGDKFLNIEEKEREEKFKEYAYQQVLEHIKKVLQRMDVEFDEWFSEKTLHESGVIQNVIDELKQKNYVYEKDGAVWLKTSVFGDDKDRVLIRESGEPTYFAADVAYHKNKLERGFNKLINIWGADHHGYIKRMKAAIRALGYPEESLEVIIGQMVNLLRAGEPVRMSKRTGEMVTLEELLDEVGKDGLRFLFLMRGTDSSLDFDIELAKKQSQENPVYYVQYAHARICSIIRFAKEKGQSLDDASSVELNLLSEEAELDLIRKLVEFEDLIERAVLSRTPHIFTKYLQDLASLFHVFYTKCRVISEDRALSVARLFLCDSTRVILKKGLVLIGVKAPESM